MDDFNQMNPGDTLEVELTSNDSFTSEFETQQVPELDVNSFSRQDIFSHQDPLKHADSYEMPSFEGVTFVDPHWVDGHMRGDGTVVEGYYRDGDGNTDVNRTKAEGGGYTREY